MLSAKDARSTAEAKNQDFLEKELKEIEILITNAIEKGDFSCRIQSLGFDAQNALKKLGYTVQYYSDQRDCEEFYTIKW
jgi:hypothetical protein